ncbi:hypothetical protein AAZX31_18G068100 [Glycine max]
MTKQIIIITFHMSGITGCETLLWILIHDFMCYCMVNLLLLLLAKFFFFNHVAQLLVDFFKYISQLMPNLELQPRVAYVLKEYQCLALHLLKSQLQFFLSFDVKYSPLPLVS